jgi:sulfite exporter TauE/SafE
VYAALAGAVTSGSPTAGAAAMSAFGLGTLPTLLALGSASAIVARAARRTWVRSVAGGAIVAFGVVQLAHAGRAWAAEGGAEAPTCCAGHHH